MSKWKTSQRRGRKLGNSDSTGNLSGHSYTDPAEPGSDGSSLSFLDDMLATAERSRGGTTRATPPQAQGEIDDILDLMGSHHSPGSRRGSDTSQLSGLSQRGKERRDQGAAPNTSPYAPRSAYAPPSGNSNSPYAPRSGGRAFQRYGSSNELSRGSRRPGSREHSRDPPSRPSFEQTSSHYHSDDHHQATHDADNYNPNSNRHDQDMSQDNDEITPIPYFSVGRDDDDTISLLTTSVTSHYEVDSRSGSFPWSRGRKSAASQGETSYADTLDEIADMLHPNQNGRSAGLTPRHTDFRRPKSPGGGGIGGGGGGTQSDDFFRPPAKVDDIFGSTNNMKGSSNAPPLNADEIYRSTKNSAKRTGQQRGTSSHNHMLSYCEPFLSQTRLLIRYWLSLIIPRSWRRKGAKDEEGQGYLGTWNNSSVGSNPRKIPRSKQRVQFWKSILFSVSGFFFVMTLVILLLRLAYMHGPKFKPTVAKIRGGMKRNKKRSKPVVDADIDGIDVHGGMAVRKDGGATSSGAIVAGGMSRHSIDEVEEEEPLDKIQVYGHGDHVGIELPAAFDNLADVKELPVRKGVEIPLFWHIPRTGGGTVNDIFGGCLGLTLAADAGASGAAGKENKLEVVKFSKHFSYVNVDTSTPAGIERAKRLELASSDLADVVVSTLLYQASSLFSPEHKGRLFTLIRHPVERAVSLFHYVQDTQWRRRQTFQKELSELTIHEYFESGLAENNWMTRFLINEPTKGELTKADVNMAKEILRKKCLVGLLSDKGESFARFERYFGFPLKDDEQKDCHEKKLQWAWPLKHRHEEVEENTPLWDLIITHNVYDMELYHYASEVLFNEQAKIFN